MTSLNYFFNSHPNASAKRIHFKLNISSVIENQESGYRIAKKKQTSPVIFLLQKRKHSTFPSTFFSSALWQWKSKGKQGEKKNFDAGERKSFLFLISISLSCLDVSVLLRPVLSLAFDERKLIFKQVLTFFSTLKLFFFELPLSLPLFMELVGL